MSPLRRPSSLVARRARVAVAALGLLLGLRAAQGQQLPDVGSEAEARSTVAASARIVNGLAIQKTQDLDLGEVRAGASAGTVRVDVFPGASSGRSASGGVVLSGSGFSAAQFQVTTAGGTSRVQISLPSAVTLSRIGGSETLVVRDFRASLQPSCLTAGQCANAVLLVGASLQVAAEQPGGSYSGTFTVTVNQF